MKEPKLKQDPSKLPNPEVLETFVKNKNGTIYQVIPHKTKKGIVLLRINNAYIEKPFVKVKQEIVDGKWSAINEHEYRDWIRKDHEYMVDLSERLVKRVMFSQLLLELDDSFEKDFQDNKHFKNVLERSKKQCERLITSQYDRLYDTDKTYVTNFMNSIDGFITTCSKLGIDDFIHLNETIADYVKNPEKYQAETVELTQLDA